jgi:hypothetical protein
LTAATTNSSASSASCRRDLELRDAREERADLFEQLLVLFGELVDLRQQDSTSDFRLSPLGESIPSGGIPSLNEAVPMRSVPHQ